MSSPDFGSVKCWPNLFRAKEKKTRGKWIDKPYAVRLAPNGWKEKLTHFEIVPIGIKAIDIVWKTDYFSRVFVV